MKRFACLAVTALLLAGAGPRTTLPAYAPAYEPSTVDERGLWSITDEYERRLRDSALLIRDEALGRYVRRVLCTTIGPERCGALRIYIVEDPSFNATIMPNGAVQVFTGLLLRVRSEAELGAVLGHEFAHFELRHSLEGYKAQRSAGDAMAWISLIGGINGVRTQDSQIGIIGSFYSFKRSQEEAADLLSVAYLAQSAYPARAASEVWQNLMAEADATAQGRKLKSKHAYSAGFFDTHPTELKRAVQLLAAAASLGDDGDPQVQGHRDAIAPHLSRFLNAQVKKNDFGGSEYLLRELAGRGGWTGDLLYARGELYRQRANPRDLTTAAQFYGEALKAGYKAPEVHRNLGLALMRSGETSSAKASLGEYLRMKPDAGDAKLIQSMIAE